MKDNLDHRKYKGVYKIEFSCGNCYIGKLGSSFHARFKEHGADIKKMNVITPQHWQNNLSQLNTTCS